MGLDISHVKLTNKPNKSTYVYTAENWDIDCNLPLETFRDVLTEVKELFFRTHIGIFRSEEDYQKSIDNGTFDKDHFVKVFIEKGGGFKSKEIQDFIRRKFLDNLESYKHYQFETEYNNIPVKIMSFGDWEMTPRFYVEELGLFHIHVI